MTRTALRTVLSTLLTVVLLAPTAANAAPDNAANPGQHLGWSVEGTTATLDHIATTTGAQSLLDHGFTGQGVGVALIDTGVAPVDGLADVLHGPDLSLDSQWEEAYQLDAYGHGTHLAGIITSDRDEALGLAPDATLLSLKAGAHNGAVDVTQVMAAIDWVVQHRDEHNIRVMVLAYGTDGVQDPQLDPLSHAVEVAWRHGIVVVVAAGNHGETFAPVATPATNPYVISVGALDTQGTARFSDDEVPAFSAPGTAERRPDVLAPGVGVVSTRVPFGYLDTTYPEARWGDDLFRGNGTSQASAVVGAGVALMLQARPELTPDDVKARLTASATTQGGVPDPGAVNFWSAHWSSASDPQTHPVSQGTGSVEASRGTRHVTADGATLTGETDIFGNPLHTSVWAPQAEAQTSWTEGIWNGTQMTGTDWSGNSWNGWGWGGWGWGGWGWGGWGWGGWGWGGGEWNGWGWGGWGWGGWGWGGWGWGGWGWGGVQWD